MSEQSRKSLQRKLEASAVTQAGRSKPLIEKSTSIAILICTRGRPNRLQDCLDSLLAMDVPPTVDPIIVVVENDDQPACHGLVLKLMAGASAKWQIKYSHEPRLGIPIARNHALDVALELDAEWVAFIDDDEVATPGWMRAMFDASLKVSADVLHGPVDFVYPATVPAWVEQKKLKQRATGTQLATAYTNNVMMKASLASSDGLTLRFDESLRFTGGSDTDYYCRAADRGAVICWVDEALVQEPVTPERLTIGWQTKRAMRVAANNTSLHWRRFGLLRAFARYAPKCVGRIIGGSLTSAIGVPLVAVGQPVGHRLFVKGLKDLYSGIGGLGAFLNFLPQPYLQIDGDQSAVVVGNASPETVECKNSMSQAAQKSGLVPLAREERRMRVAAG